MNRKLVDQRTWFGRDVCLSVWDSASELVEGNSSMTWFFKRRYTYGTLPEIAGFSMVSM